ncbi:MAG: hypothetical protein S4CHLAM20_04110 [Chlamydiia bacterium]|nr:hypothetical protein [Chlamydiia bacterium]
MGIQIADFKGAFTKAVVDVYAERPRVKGFASSFFGKKFSDTKEVSIEVQRGSERLAVDVVRGTEGNRNSMNRSSEKIFVPPLFKEYFDATSLKHYDRTFAAPNGIVDVSGASVDAMIEDTTFGLGLLQDKIERTTENQAWQVFLDGIVTLVNGVNIDFKRKAASKVDESGIPWDNDSNDPFVSIQKAGTFLREVGKAQGNIFNVIMGEDAYASFIRNENTKDTLDNRRMDLGFIGRPQEDIPGGSFHGTIAAGNKNYNIWTSSEGYEDAQGNFIKFMDAKQVVVIPQSPRFVQAFGAVPMVMEEGGNQRIVDAMGEFHISDIVDVRKKSHDFIIESASIMIPSSVDQIYTVKVLA